MDAHLLRNFHNVKLLPQSYFDSPFRKYRKTSVPNCLSSIDQIGADYLAKCRWHPEELLGHWQFDRRARVSGTNFMKMHLQFKILFSLDNGKEWWRTRYLHSFKIQPLVHAQGLWLPKLGNCWLWCLMQNQVTSACRILVASLHEGIRSHLNLTQKLLDIVKYAYCCLLACHTSAPSLETPSSCWEGLTWLKSPSKFNFKVSIYCMHWVCNVAISIPESDLGGVEISVMGSTALILESWFCVSHLMIMTKCRFQV